MVTSYGFADGGRTPDWVLNDFYPRRHLYASAACLVELLAVELTNNGHRHAGQGRLDIFTATANLNNNKLNSNSNSSNNNNNNNVAVDSFQCYNIGVITYPRQGNQAIVLH